MSHPAFIEATKRVVSGQMPLVDLIGIAEQLQQARAHDLLVQLYKLWIEHNDQDPLVYAAHFNLAANLSEYGEYDEAIAHLRRAIEISPDFSSAYINLGSAMEKKGQPGAAVQSWLSLCQRYPSITGPIVEHVVTALKQIGRVFELNRKYANAEKFLCDALALNPYQGDVVQHYTALRLVQCNWPAPKALANLTRKDILKGTGPLSMAIYADDPFLQLGCAWNYCRNHVGYAQSDFSSRFAARRQEVSSRRLRIGYVSSDMRNHAVGYQMAELFACHDRGKYEVTIYYCGIPGEDDIKSRIKNDVEHWVDISALSDFAAAQKILMDEIDILIDVNGYTKDAKTQLFAMKPAPIIANWFGFPGTMGSPYHHYIIADEHIIPPEYEKFYSEKVLRLPCYQPNDTKRPVLATPPSREACGLPEDAFVYCCFNGSQKISPHTFARWSEILRQVPNSVMWILDPGDEVAENLRAHAQKAGLDPARLIFAPKMHNHAHLARIPLADVFLDTSPYGAHVTAADALWMGIPVVTMMGISFASRVCGSLCHAAGVPDTVCADSESYIRCAVSLGNDPEVVQALKQKFEQNKTTCTLFDIKNLTTHLEGLFEEMWQDFIEDRLPVPDLINMETYLDIGCENNHDDGEFYDFEQYLALYKKAFAKRHAYCALPNDHRFWTQDAMEND